MAQFTDEQLMAVADGQCDPQEARAIEQAVKLDPELGKRLAAFEQSRQVLRRAFDARRGEPIPDRLLGVFGKHARPAAAPRARRFFYPVALAASVAVATVASLAYWLAPGPSTTILPEPALLAALENTPSGIPFAATVDARRYELVPVRTLRLEDGSWCREFDFAELAGDAVTSGRGLACRETDGQWAMRALLPAAPSQQIARDDGYRMAAGPDALSGLGPIETVSPTQEAQLIAQHWR
jgi:hypothetical protein